MVNPSCYVLELSVAGGGARRCTFFIYNRLEHIRACLAQEFLSDDPAINESAAYMAVCYGETITLSTVIAGKVTKVIDLNPYIRISFDGGPMIVLTETAPHKDAWWPDGEELTKSVCFEVDWDAIAAVAPPLTGELLKPGQRISLEFAEALPYGYSDIEASSDDVGDWVDPDPPQERS